MANIGELPDAMTLDEILEDAPEQEAEVTFQDALYEEEDQEAEATEEIEAGDPEGLYADFEDGSADTAEEEIEAQKDGEAEVVPEATPRAQNRIQKLVSERNEANEQISAMQQQMLQMQQQMVQSEQARSQREVNRDQAEETRRVASKRIAEEQDLTAFEKWELDQKRNSQSALQQMEERLRSEFAQKEQERQQSTQARYAEAEKQRRYASVNSQADVAVEEFLQEFAPEAQESLRELSKTYILTQGAAFGQAPSEAVAGLKQFLLGYQKADHQRRLAAQQAKPRAAKSGRVVRPTTQQAPVTEEPDLSRMSPEEMLSYFVGRK